MAHLLRKHTLQLFAFAVIFFSSTVSFSQQSKYKQIVDSYQGADRIERLYSYGEKLKQEDADELYQVAKGLAEYSKRLDDKVGITYSHALFVRYYNWKEDYGNILNHSMKAMEHHCPDTLDACIKIRASISKILSSIGQYDAALEQEFHILNYYRNTENWMKANKQSVKIGKIYIQKNEVESGFKYYHQSIFYIKKSGNERGLRSGYNTLGLVHLEQNNLDSAQYYFEKGIEVFRTHPIKSNRDSTMFGLINGNLGNIYFLRGDLDRALQMLEIDRSYNMRNGGNLSSFNANLLIARIYLKKNDPTSAIEYVKMAKHAADVNPKPGYNLLEMYRVCTNIHLEMGQYEQASKCFAKYTDLSDSLKNEKASSQQKQQQAFIDEIINRELELQRIANEKKQQEIKSLQQQELLSRYKIITLISVFAILVVLSVLYILRYRSNVKKKQEMNRIKAQLIKAELANKELEQGLLKEELSLKDSQLTNLALDISRKHDFTDSLMKRLKNLRKNASPEIVAEVNELMIFARNELNIDSSLHELQENIAKIHFSFFENLQKKHPELTKTEKYMCGLLRIELSNNEIAILRGVSVDSVKVSKNRLRRKMGLEQRSNLTNYLREL